MVLYCVQCLKKGWWKHLHASNTFNSNLYNVKTSFLTYIIETLILITDVVLIIVITYLWL